MTLGEFLKQKRLGKDLSLRKVVKGCGGHFSASSLGKWENGKVNPKFIDLVFLSRFLDFTLYEAAEYIPHEVFGGPYIFVESTQAPNV